MIFQIIDFYYQRRILFFSLIAFLLLMLLGTVWYCGNRTYSYPEELLLADSLCDTNPDSARVLLEKSKPLLESESDDANWYCQLLKMKAQVKLGTPITSDAEVKRLVAHYENGGDKRLLPLAYYCAGYAYHALMDTPQACDYYLKAVELLNHNGDRTLYALCCYQLGINFAEQALYDESIKWGEKALAIHKKLKKYRRCIYDYESLAWTYGCIGRKNDAFRCISEARKLITAIDDTADLAEIECQMAIHYMENRQLEKAKEHIDVALRASDGSLSYSQIYSTALEIYSKLGFGDKADEYCDSVMSRGNLYGKRYAYWWMSKRALKNSDMETAMSCIDKYRQFSDSVKNIRATEASARAIALYNYGLREKENLRLHEEVSNKNKYMVIVSLLLLVCLMLSYGVYHRVTKQKRMAAERCEMLGRLLEREKDSNGVAMNEKKAEIQKLKEQLECLKEQDVELRKHIDGLLKEKESYMEMLDANNRQREQTDLYIKTTAVYKRVQKALNDDETVRFTDWEELKDAVYAAYPSFESQLLQLGDISDVEQRVCLLIRLGIGDARQISKIVCKSRSTIYTINRRLYFKIFGHYAPPSEWVKFIMSAS